MAHLRGYLWFAAPLFIITMVSDLFPQSEPLTCMRPSAFVSGAPSGYSGGWVWQDGRHVVIQRLTQDGRATVMIRLFDGSEYKTILTKQGSDDLTIDGVWGRAPNDLFITVSTKSQSGLPGLYHYDGSFWRRIDSTASGPLGGTMEGPLYLFGVRSKDTARVFERFPDGRMRDAQLKYWDQLQTPIALTVHNDSVAPFGLYGTTTFGGEVRGSLYVVSQGVADRLFSGTPVWPKTEGVVAVNLEGDSIAYLLVTHQRAPPDSSGYVVATSLSSSSGAYGDTAVVWKRRIPLPNRPWTGMAQSTPVAGSKRFILSGRGGLYLLNWSSGELEPVKAKCGIPPSELFMTVITSGSKVLGLSSDLVVFGDIP